MHINEGAEPLLDGEQAARIFERIDAEPDVFEGVPLRWCAPIAAGDEDPRYLPGGKYGDTPRPELREFSWFGRLGAGDILARYRSGQDEHALRLILRYAAVVDRLGNVPECLDMHGKPRRGTGGAGDYLEHAGGYLWCVGAGLFGIDDSKTGVLTWTPRVPSEIPAASTPLWHMGTCWEFGWDAESLWIDPNGAEGTVQLVRDGSSIPLLLKGKRVQMARLP